MGMEFAQTATIVHTSIVFGPRTMPRISRNWPSFASVQAIVKSSLNPHRPDRDIKILLQSAIAWPAERRSNPHSFA